MFLTVGEYILVGIKALRISPILELQVSSTYHRDEGDVPTSYKSFKSNKVF